MKRKSGIKADLPDPKEGKRKKYRESPIVEDSEKTIEFFTNALRNSPVSVAAQDRDLLFIWAFNQKITDQVELVGYFDKDIFTHAEAQHFTEVKKRVLKEGITLTEERWLNRPSGPKYLSITFDPITDEKGNIIGVSSAIVDLTERKKAEDALRASEERYRSLFDNMTEGFAIHEIITDEKGRPVDYRFLDVNHAFERLTGLKRDDLIGRRVLEILPETENYWIENYGRVVLTGESQYFENYSAQLGRWYEVFAYRSAPGRFAVMFTDISARKETEKALKQSEENYRLSKTKLDLALENANIGLWEWNVKTNEIIWDERSKRMLGIEPGMQNGTYEMFMHLIHEEDMDHMQRAVNDALKNEEPFQTIFRTKPEGGKYKYISSKALVNRDEDGSVLSLTGVNFDITGLTENNERIISKLNEDLLRSNRELENFAYITSHDLQEPLRMVTSYSQLLARKYGDSLDNDARDYINFSVEGAKRMYDLINGLLAYSRISRKETTFSEVDTNNILMIAKSNLAFAIKERNCIIESSDLPVVFADPNQMTILFQNLISNGIKFSDGIPRISVSCEQEGGRYLFSVRDEGIGIEDIYHEKIFEIFKRLMPRERYEGTGIGLAICKRIVENHGGTIWVESTPGEGSVFHFTIPVHR